MGGPICLFSYSVILRCFVVRIYALDWIPIDHCTNTLQWICPIIEKDKERMRTIHRVPIVEGQTFDSRRLVTISPEDIKNRE